MSESFCSASNTVISTAIHMPDAEVILFEDCFGKADSDRLFEMLLREVAWQERKIKLYGREFAQPRLTAWYGDAEAVYTYSNLTWQPLPWLAALREIKQQCDEIAGVNFNSVLLNLYRHERDSMSWHQDNEPELGEQPVIASVSFGETRRFQFRHQRRKDLGTINVDLKHGSLLLMKGTTQQFWRHQVPKSATAKNARINLTFRVIQPLSERN